MSAAAVFLAFALLVTSPPAAVLGWNVRDPLVLDWPQLPGSWVEEDFDTVSFPQGSGASAGIVQWSLSKTVPSTGRNYTIHIGSLSSGLPNTFSFQLPDGGKWDACLLERLELTSRVVQGH